MNAKTLREAIAKGLKDNELSILYGQNGIGLQRDRYAALCGKLALSNPDDEAAFYSAPGRTELGGNHTDHNLGRVLAASVQLDTVGLVCRNDDGVINIDSEGFPDRIRVSLSDPAPKERETGRPESIVRGIAARFAEKGFQIGGFNACFSSTVPIGGGLSSSASFEVLVGTILSSLYNRGTVPQVEIALACQYAENRYFGKPCGLMDQLASVTGGIAAIDFRNPEKPDTKKVEADFGKYGLSLVILGTGGHHADLTHEYAAIPGEMRAVAAALGKGFLAEVDPVQFMAALPRIRASVGDRALLRAFHFMTDTERVRKQVEALGSCDIGTYLSLVNDSGNSSWKLLQNCYPPSTPEKQGISLALALTERFLEGEGASRVHGSGFGGAIQAYIPSHRLDEYRRLMEPVFGKECVTPLFVRNTGASAVF